MCKQMILAVLICAVTFRAESECQLRMIRARPATDSTFMEKLCRCSVILHLFVSIFSPILSVSCPARPESCIFTLALSNGFPVIGPSDYLFRFQAFQVFAGQIEQEEIEQRKYYRE